MKVFIIDKPEDFDKMPSFEELFKSVKEEDNKEKNEKFKQSD